MRSQGLKPFPRFLQKGNKFENFKKILTKPSWEKLSLEIETKLSWLQAVSSGHIFALFWSHFIQIVNFKDLILLQSNYDRFQCFFNLFEIKLNIQIFLFLYILFPM